MLATSKNVLFPEQIITIMLTTGTDDPSLSLSNQDYLIKVLGLCTSDQHGGYDVEIGHF